MAYPTIGKAEARSYLVPHAEGEEPALRLPPARYVEDGPEEDWDSIGEQAASLLLAVIEQTSSEGEVEGARFETVAGPELHRLLPEHPALADPEFWIWLALAHCQEVVDRRYGPVRNPKNFGVGGAGENLLYRLWLRAEIAFDPQRQNQYELAAAGDIDFWRSHIFRQGYADARGFARALIEFQFPRERDRKAYLKIDQIRALAKHLKRARSNLLFEVMSGKRAIQFIESEWGRLASVD